MYYIEDGYTIEEVTIVGNEGDKFVIQDKDGYTYFAPKYKCYNSKEEIVNKVLDNLKYDVEQAKYDLEHAQDALEIAQEELEVFKQKYEI